MNLPGLTASRATWTTRNVSKGIGCLQFCLLMTPVTCTRLKAGSTVFVKLQLNGGCQRWNVKVMFSHRIKPLESYSKWTERLSCKYFKVPASDLWKENPQGA
jgi:hypothetical protein